MLQVILVDVCLDLVIRILGLCVVCCLCVKCAACFALLCLCLAGLLVRCVALEDVVWGSLMCIVRYWLVGILQNLQL